MNKEIAKAFCNQCQCAHESWLIFVIVFNNFQSAARVSFDDAHETPIGNSINLVARMCYLSWITQVVRLNDPAKTQSNENLSIHLMLEAECWNTEEKDKLEKLSKELCKLPKLLKPVCDKLIFHNDLKTILSDDGLGEFPTGMDKNFYHSLSELATMVWGKWCLPSTNPYDQNRIFDFALDTPADYHSTRYMAEQLRDCLHKELQEKVKQIT